MNAAVEAIRNGALPDDYKTIVDEALAGSLKDPDSRKLVFGKTKAGLVCGDVNAKNSFGGYTGFVPFVAGFGPDRHLIGIRIVDGSSSEFAGPEQAALGSVAIDCALGT